ncbi:MAG: hypothetical protein F6K39_44440, partial [Okeania sp. SIO3B3]|nr:hypothetical protein [Okeania sp. SIO3B3]
MTNHENFSFYPLKRGGFQSQFFGKFKNINGTWLRWCDADRNVIKTGDEIAAEKNLEISQKDAQIKQALLLAIEMGLKFKFGDEY